MNRPNKFKCPKSLSDVVSTPDQAGTRTQCPTCQATLTVPASAGNDSLFDDLFDDDPSESGGNSGIHVDGSGEATVDESRSETKFPELAQPAPKPSPEIETDIPTSDLPELSEITEVEEVVSEDDVSLDVEPMIDLDVGSMVGETEKEIESEESKDPFAYDENKTIKIDGVGGKLQTPDSFYFKCPVCDSQINVVDDQIGETVECTDCFSEIEVVKPKKSKPDPWQRPARMRSSDEDEELKLAQPIERPAAVYISPDHAVSYTHLTLPTKA